MDQLDKLREEKIVEYVIILQSYFRMCKDLQYFRRFRRHVCRIQGYIKTQVRVRGQGPGLVTPTRLPHPRLY